MRVAPAILLVPVLVAACDRVDHVGSHFIEAEQCWRTEVAFRGSSEVGDLEIFTRDPDGDCWFFSSYPDFPEEWGGSGDGDCTDLPGVEDGTLTDAALCE